MISWLLKQLKAALGNIYTRRELKVIGMLILCILFMIIVSALVSCGPINCNEWWWGC